MSSAKYVAELQPDPLMRLAVHLWTLLVGAIGFLVMYHLPIDAWVRTIAIVAWFIRLSCLVARTLAAEQRVVRMRLFGDGTAALLRPDGRWTPAELAAKSTVLTNLAWLQFKVAAARPHTELLRGTSREGKDWRRLQVIWRHRENSRHSALGSGS